MTASPKLISVVGATASGKSAWAVKLAKKFNGVIISADSRQVYKGLDIATAKITKTEMGGVPHYLLDVVRPNEEFNVAIYQKLVGEVLNKLRRARKSPVIFLVGGTGLYVAAITEGYRLPAAPDPKLRSQLEKLPLARLVARLRRIDPKTKVDLKNKRRVIRAIEILHGGGQPTKTPPDFEVLKIGIKLPRETIYKNIERRVHTLDWDGLTRETRRLMRAGFDFNSNPLTAIYYRFVRDHLEGELTKDQTLTKLIQGDKNYAKRQLTWFNKDKQIHWVTTPLQAERLVRQFLND